MHWFTCCLKLLAYKRFLWVLNIYCIPLVNMKLIKLIVG
jgi:hypothetical protein